MILSINDFWKQNIFVKRLNSIHIDSKWNTKIVFDLNSEKGGLNSKYRLK